MKTIKSRIGLAVVCITAVAIADGGNVVSFEKTFAAKDSAEVSAGTCAASIGTERLADARSVGLQRKDGQMHWSRKYASARREGTCGGFVYDAS